MKPYNNVHSEMPVEKFLSALCDGEPNRVIDSVFRMYTTGQVNNVLYEEHGDKAIVLTLHLEVNEGNVIFDMNSYKVKPNIKNNKFDGLMKYWEMV